jgi:hypothetical protein
LVQEFLKIYKPSRNPKCEYTFNFQGRQKTKFILLFEYSSNKHWKEKFFFTQGDWEFPATEVIAVPRVPREARRLSSSGQKEPILSKSEKAYVHEMIEYVERDVLEMEFNAIFSQSALAACLKYPPNEGIVGGGAPMGPKLKKKMKAMALQILESQSTEAAKPKSPILPLDKSPSEVEVERSSKIFQEEILEPLTKFAAAQTSPKRHKRTTKIPRKEVSKLPEHTTIQPSPAKQTAHPRQTREEKGKDKVGDDASPTSAVAGFSTIPEAAEEYVESPLSGVMASRTESEMVGTLLGKIVEAEPTGVTTESYSYDMLEALKVDFLNSLINMKKLIQKRWPILLDSHDARSLDKAIIVGENMVL